MQIYQGIKKILLKHVWVNFHLKIKRKKKKLYHIKKIKHVLGISYDFCIVTFFFNDF